MDDSFVERMRKRALERLERNAHIIQPDEDLDYPSLSKKLKSPLPIVERENKENINDNTAFVSNPTKPVIAEHLTVRKSLIVDNVNCDEPGAFVMRNTRKPSFAEENNYGQREDVYVKHCKNRLANLAGKFKTFEEEDNTVSLRPTPQKQTTVKRRSAEDESELKEINHKNIKCESKPSPQKVPEINPNLRFIASPQKKIMIQSPKKVNKPVETKPPEKGALEGVVVKTLESQGFKRTESDAHLFYDFKTAKNTFNKENVVINPVPKPKRQFDIVRTEPVKTEHKEISNLFSNSKYQDNPFIQNSRKVQEDTNGEPDPSLLTVAERRKLFEKRLRGEIDEKPAEQAPLTTSAFSARGLEEKIVNMAEDESDYHEEYNSGNEYSTCDSDNDVENGHLANRTPSSDEDMNSEFEQERRIEKEADLSQYPMLESVKKVKFMSTPKPGRLYPSVSDLDGEIDEDLDVSKHETSYKSPNPDDSFGREVLCATNSIFSSFQNSRKETSDFEKSKQDILSEVRDLINPGNDTSLSLSPMMRSSLASVECPNETASFTYLKNYANNSVEDSPRRYYKKVIQAQSDRCGEDEYDAKKVENDETNVVNKIKYLEEQIVKEKIILSQEIRALKYCLSTSFMNSTSHLEAEKFVLLSHLRIEEAQNEIQRIKIEKSVRPYSSSNNSVRGNVVISKIRLPVKMAVVHSNLKDDIENNLICIVKCGEVVLATEVVPVVQSRIRQDMDCTYIEFPDTITVPDVTSDFKIRVEVYNLVVDKKDPSSAKGKDKDKKNLMASKKSKKAKLFTTPFTHEDKKNPHSSFYMIGYMIFSQNLAQRHQWMLNKFHVPLVGMIMMDLKCNLAKITVQKHGFLTMYEIISGYGAWSRYWFYLDGDKLSFWKYPEQESVQEPIGTFDLKKCITKDVVVVGYDIVFRPQTFILKFDPPTYLKQFKNLTEDRLLLSADTEEERISWCDFLNEVLKSVRSWSSPSE